MMATATQQPPNAPGQMNGGPGAKAASGPQLRRYEDQSTGAGQFVDPTQTNELGNARPQQPTQTPVQAQGAAGGKHTHPRPDPSTLPPQIFDPDHPSPLPPNTTVTHDTLFLKPVTHERIRPVEVEEVQRVREVERHVHHVVVHYQPVKVLEEREEEVRGEAVEHGPGGEITTLRQEHNHYHFAPPASSREEADARLASFLQKLRLDDPARYSATMGQSTTTTTTRGEWGTDELTTGMGGMSLTGGGGATAGQERYTRGQEGVGVVGAYPLAGAVGRHEARESGREGYTREGEGGRTGRYAVDQVGSGTYGAGGGSGQQMGGGGGTGAYAGQGMGTYGASTTQYTGQGENFGNTASQGRWTSGTEGRQIAGQQGLSEGNTTYGHWTSRNAGQHDPDQGANYGRWTSSGDGQRAQQEYAGAPQGGQAGQAGPVGENRPVEHLPVGNNAVQGAGLNGAHQHRHQQQQDASNHAQQDRYAPTAPPDPNTNADHPTADTEADAGAPKRGHSKLVKTPPPPGSKRGLRMSRSADRKRGEGRWSMDDHPSSSTSGGNGGLSDAERARRRRSADEAAWWDEGADGSPTGSGRGRGRKAKWWQRLLGVQEPAGARAEPFAGGGRMNVD